MLVRLLGGVEIAGTGGEWRTVPGKRGGVLAVLAVAARQPVPADELAHRVWGDAATELGTSAVYPHITRLRAMLPADGAAITRSGGGYVLDIEPDEVDLPAVRRLAVRAREDTEAGRYPRAVGTWRQASALLRGEALAGVDGGWAEQVRQQFSVEARSILAQRFGLELRLGHHLAVVDELLAALSRYPACEALAEQLMLALYRSGRQAESLEVFARTASRLRDQLGIDPSASFRRLHRQILNQDEAIAAPQEAELAGEPPVIVADSGFVPPAQLPAPARGFVGRETAIEALRRAVDRSSVVVVDGMPGVGKTAIAVHTATWLAERYPDGQLFVELHGFSGDVAVVPPADALERMLRGLGAADSDIPAGVDGRSAELRTRLAGRRVLIVLDNAADAAQVRPLLPGDPACLTIVTSRRRMPDLLEAAPITLNVMEPDEAVRLLVTTVDDPLRCTEDSGSAVEIVEAAGRLPLAIRLIAARLRNRRHWTLDYLLRRLRERPVLDELAAQDAAVASAFTLSYTELDVEHQRMFRLLGLYPGQDFDAGFAAVLAGVTPEAADRSLEELVDAHLLQSGEPDRYRFHDLMRHFAATIVAETEAPAEIEAARRRMYDTTVVLLRHAIAQFDSYVGFYPRLVDASEPPASPWHDRVAATDWVRTEVVNLRAIMRSSHTYRMDRHCAELAAALSSLFSHFGHDNDMESVAEFGLDSALRIADEECEGYFLNKLAMVHRARNDTERAEQCYLRALEIRRRLGDSRYIVGTLANLGLLYGSIGERHRAIAMRREAIELAVTSGNTELEVIIRIMLAHTLCSVGRVVEARSQLELAEAGLSGSGDEQARIRLVEHWGDVLREEGDPVAAQRLHEEALAYYRATREWVGMAVTQIEIAQDLIDQGRWDEAWEYGNTARTTLPERARPDLRAEALLVLAEVCLARGEHDRALERLRTVEDIGRGCKAAALVADGEWGIARAARALGDNDTAVQYATRALAYYSRFGMPRTERVRRFLDGAQSADPR